MDKIRQINLALQQALLGINEVEAEKIIVQAMEAGSPIEVAGNLISSTLTEIGDLWEHGKISLSQVYLSGVFCERVIDKVLPPKSQKRISQPKMAIAVFEDFHMLGKRIVYSALRASGYELIDLGGGLKTETIVSMVKEQNIKILLLSVLMLPSALRIKELVKELNNTNVKIIVGGAPFRFDEELWKEIGAYACGKDSADALMIVNQIMEEVQ